MEHYFTGSIERLIFESSKDFFKIILLNLEDTDSELDDFEVIVTGNVADVIEGEAYTFWGQLTQHPKYGQQVKISRYEKAKPSQSGLVKYFASDHFKGIGLKTAERIVTLYGEEAIDKILADPSKLNSITGLSKTVREAFVSKLRSNYGTEQILAKLASYGLTNRLAFQVFDTYKEESLDIIAQNPYQLVEDIKGIGFKLADQVAQELGIESQAPERLRAALLHCLLETSLETGDTYVEAKQLLEKALVLLEHSRPVTIDPEILGQQISQLILEDKVQNLDTRIFDNSLFYAEAGIKKHLTRILETRLGEPISAAEIDQELDMVEKQLSISYNTVQKKAIHQALNSKVFVLTGGPGTGKTTVIKGLIETYARLHQVNLSKGNSPILLAAPTGRAARRMTELTGLPSATIHRQLGLNGDNDYQTLDDYLDADLIIVDEFSMVDTWLANQLFSAISSNTQVIIVGDSDQLPSVGPGQVLADLLKITDLPKLALTKIFRQSDDSTIVSLASQINQGHLPTDFTQKKPDRSYFEATSPHIPDMISQIVQAALRNGIAKEDVQILAPMYRGQAGITNLNQLLQDLLNPREDQLEFLGTEVRFRQGDKVLHLVNDSEQNVFNGDIGYITELIPAKYSDSKQDELVIIFDGSEVIYPRNDWSKITLAYAMSIHKSQGSEFPVVILPMTLQSSRMLQRNLLYTAITRAKSKLILLGEIRAFEEAAKNEGTSRKTYLVQRFQVEESLESPDKTSKHHDINYLSTDKLADSDVIEENLAPSPEETILTKDNLHLIDPMIGISAEDIALFFAK